jgi:hypothetical protein
MYLFRVQNDICTCYAYSSILLFLLTRLALAVATKTVHPTSIFYTRYPLLLGGWDRDVNSKLG